MSKLIQEIQYILAPAIMISSSALLLLGFQNKFSNLANRFRVLNQEKQVLSRKTARSEEEEKRHSNLKDQVEYLFQRSTLVKNAILLTYGGIFFFTGTSILILLDIYSSLQLHAFIIMTFAAGLSFLLATAVVMLLETKLFYRVILLEKKSWFMP